MNMDLLFLNPDLDIAGYQNNHIKYLAGDMQGPIKYGYNLYTITYIQ
jgi:hypothetical protein